MMAVLGAIALLAAAEPPDAVASEVDVYCDAMYQTRGGRTFRVNVTCPDVDNRESLERQTREQVEGARSVLGDISIRDLPGRVYFRRIESEDGTDWQVLPGVISRLNAYYPQNPVRSHVSGACTARFDIIDGTPENICITCRAREYRGEFIREMRRSIRRSFYVQTDRPVEQVFRVNFPLPEAAAPDFPPATPAETLCELDIKASGLSRAQRIVEADLGCPPEATDADALATRAAALIARLDTRRLRHPHILTAEQVAFSRDGADGWQAAPGQMIVSVPFEYPDALIREGADRLACAWSAWPDRCGRPRNVRVTCYVDGRVRPLYQVRRAEDAVEDMVRTSRFFPVDVDYCYQDE
ncbi:Uncharacterized protein SCF082_LOCUS31510, partial [Durusdinium trenchii]